MAYFTDEVEMSLPRSESHPETSTTSFTTQGKGSSTELALQSNQTVKIYLDLDSIVVSTHDSESVCGGVVSQALDNARWGFRFIRF